MKEGRKAETMREFMAKVRDRLSEGWNDPERREDRLAVVIIGTTAAVVVVALLLVLFGVAAIFMGRVGI